MLITSKPMPCDMMAVSRKLLTKRCLVPGAEQDRFRLAIECGLEILHLQFGDRSRLPVGNDLLGADDHMAAKIVAIDPHHFCV